jgi:hypothetical protein
MKMFLSPVIASDLNETTLGAQPQPESTTLERQIHAMGGPRMRHEKEIVSTRKTGFTSGIAPKSSPRCAAWVGHVGVVFWARKWHTAHRPGALSA